ncbi:hypothetical protein GCM10009754_57640 [Amycolatopsis minnesotensis]|uniref:Uncharacterized protein n=1 Tax=Amycolatopsis minnesotensis TaxID=337894 RepID=A0ABN2RV34_9PSEU
MSFVVPCVVRGEIVASDSLKASFGESAGRFEGRILLVSACCPEMYSGPERLRAGVNVQVTEGPVRMLLPSSRCSRQKGQGSMRKFIRRRHHRRHRRHHR